MAAILLDTVDKKKQLDELIGVQKAIVVDCFLIIKDISFLSETGHPKDIADIIAADRFFIRAGKYMWTILVLELNKLFDKREGYSLNKLLNIVVNQHREITWAKHVDLTVIGSLKEEIEGEKVQSIFENLNHIRDKAIAHLDRNRMSREVLVHLDEAKYLVELGQRTLSEVHWQLNGAGLSLDVEFLGLCEITIMNLVAYHKIRD